LAGEAVSISARTIQRRGDRPVIDQAVAALVTVRDRVRYPYIGGVPEVRATSVTMVLRPRHPGGDDGAPLRTGGPTDQSEQWDVR
jgi:hypothetical protein